jgi:hypothetical protein
MAPPPYTRAPLQRSLKLLKKENRKTEKINKQIGFFRLLAGFCSVVVLVLFDMCESE